MAKELLDNICLLLEELENIWGEWAPQKFGLEITALNGKYRSLKKLAEQQKDGTAIQYLAVYEERRNAFLSDRISRERKEIRQGY